MKLKDLISEQSISAELAATEKKRALAELSALLANGSRGVRADEILRALVDRERLATTGVGAGVALPHAKIPGLTRAVAAVGIARAGIPFDAVDGADVRIFVALVSPDHGDAGEHLRVLARLSRVLKDPALRDELLGLRAPAEILAALVAADERG